MNGRGTTIVTGGAGFIGSELVRQLADAGARVVVIDNLINGRRENLADLPGDCVTLLEHDVRNVSAYAALLPEVDVIYHLACLGVRHSVHSPLENHEVNATATLRLLEASRSADVPKFSMQNLRVRRSMPEPRWWAPMNEDHPTFPCTVYGGSKLAGEAYARAFYRTYAYPTVVVRPFNTYGPRSHHEGDSGEVIPKFLLRCLAGKPMMIFGDGTQTRDFTYVSDSARGIVLAGTCSRCRPVGRTINLGSGHEVTVNELARAVAQVAERADAQVVHDEPRPGDVLRLCADMSQARALLGYEVQIPLADGLGHLLEWCPPRLETPLRKHCFATKWSGTGTSNRL